MNRVPLVSIIITNFNYGRFLGEAIDSALAQSYPDVEVVVVDDGSTDDSREVIAGYGERLVAVLKENGGQGSAVNAGFAASRGEIVIFLDADDVLLPETVQRVVEAWHPGLSKIQYLLEIIDVNGQLQGRFTPTESLMPSGQLRDLILSSGTYPSSPMSGNAFARDVLTRILPIPEEQEWRISADGYLVNLVPFIGEVLSLNERLGLYRVHPSNNWKMQEVELPKIRRFLEHDIQKQELLRAFGTDMGIEVPRDLALRVPAHIKFRLASLRMDRQEHPYPEDTRWFLVRRGISSCWRSSEFSLPKRVFYSMWFALVGVFPESISVPLISVGLMPTRRPRYMNSWMFAKHGERTARDN